MTQNEMIMQHLRDRGSITALEAMNEYGIMRLPSRINELREDGAPIDGRMESGKNRFGVKTHYKRYYLRGTAS